MRLQLSVLLWVYTLFFANPFSAEVKSAVANANPAAVVGTK